MGEQYVAHAQSILCVIGLNVSIMNTQPVANFGKRVRLLREQAGLKQDELAHRARIHRAHMSLIETGDREPRLRTILRIAEALEVEPGELFQEG